jgi:hypothetical protein
LRVRVPATVVLLMLMDGIALAATVPLPRPRPADAAPSVSLPGAGFTPSLQADHRPSACRAALQVTAVFEPLPRVTAPGGCGIADPVRLKAVILSDESRVTVSPPAELDCGMASAVAAWIREDMAPAVARLGAPLRAIENFDSYSCRGRNRVFGARLSEHARGNALDIRAVVLADGTVTHLTGPSMEKDVRLALRSSACERFTTVLGPGSDGYHEDHVHVDLAERRGGYRICQWEVRTPAEAAVPRDSQASARVPLPVPRPAAAGQRTSAQR